MLAQYSYKYHFLAHILENSRELFPGATRVLALYYSNDIPGIKVLERKLDEENENTIVLDRSDIQNEDIDLYRKQRPRYSWLDKNLSTTSKSEDQLKIQGELKNHTLLVRFPNSGDGLNDLLFVFFKNEEQVFRISGRQQQLSTELKQSLASVYVRNLDVIRKQIENDKYIYDVLKSHAENKKSIESSYKKEIVELKRKQYLIYKSIGEQLIDRLIPSNDYTFIWEEESIQYLSENINNLSEIEIVLKRALIIAINESLDVKGAITILPSYLYTDSRASQHHIDVHVSENLQRTISMLDRYEKAASELINLKQSITGQNLGNQLQPSVTPAAISDAISKHSVKITRLLNEYPDRWSILRTHFKAIQNKIFIPSNLDQMAS